MASLATSGRNTAAYVMQQTMLRVKEPKRSLEFYTNVLGMELIEHMDFPQYSFSLYFVGYLPEGMTREDMPPVGQRHQLASTLPGLIELTHNHGTETAEGDVYHVGNNVGGVNGGFGHIGVTLPDVYAACARFKDLGVRFKKSPNSGGMKGLAFIYDPDGYAIEIIAQRQGTGMQTQPVDCFGFDLEGKGGSLPEVAPAPVDLTTGGGACMDAAPFYDFARAPETAGWIMQQTMLRVKDPKVSLPFYTDVLGMTLVKRLDFAQWGFSLFFMGYLPNGMTAADLPPEDSAERMDFLWSLPATIELTHNHGSEKPEAPAFHPGNSSDGVNGGFGHIGITVPNVYEACDRFHELGVEFKKSPNQGGMKGLAFIKDPDGYWIEVINQGPPKPKQDVDCLGVHIEGGGSYTGGGGGSATAK